MTTHDETNAPDDDLAAAMLRHAGNRCIDHLLRRHGVVDGTWSATADNTDADEFAALNAGRSAIVAAFPTEEALFLVALVDDVVAQSSATTRALEAAAHGLLEKRRGEAAEIARATEQPPEPPVLGLMASAAASFTDSPKLPTCTPNDARAEGRRWAEDLARDMPGGPRGPWTGTVPFAIAMLESAYSAVLTAHAEVCWDAADAAWRALVTVADERRQREREERVERMFARVEHALSRTDGALARVEGVLAPMDGRWRLVGSAVVQAPIVVDGLETPHGPLLILLETWADHAQIRYSASLPVVGLTEEATNAPEAVEALLGKVAAQVLHPPDQMSRDEALRRRALLALVRPAGVFE